MDPVTILPADVKIERDHLGGHDVFYVSTTCPRCGCEHGVLAKTKREAVHLASLMKTASLCLDCLP